MEMLELETADIGTGVLIAVLKASMATPTASPSAAPTSHPTRFRSVDMTVAPIPSPTPSMDPEMGREQTASPTQFIGDTDDKTDQNGVMVDQRAASWKLLAKTVRTQRMRAQGGRTGCLACRGLSNIVCKSGRCYGST